MIHRYMCILCGKSIIPRDVETHKKSHEEGQHYGIMWPCCVREETKQPTDTYPIYDSPILAEKIGVRKVYLKNEGANPSGSMKDYLVRKAIHNGAREGLNTFTVVSSGNHAVSLAKFTNSVGFKSIVFVPASSSKLNFLSSFSSNLVVGIDNTIFEDVYVLANKIQLDGVYNANVSNETLLTGFKVVADRISLLNPLPTHVLSGVGNGSYLAGISWGLERLGVKKIKIIPVGMLGAFPTKTAFELDKFIHDYGYFGVPESWIDAAEGSIAIASYAMPQLMHGIKISNGFPLGELTNKDLAQAYDVLLTDKKIIDCGAIPEPTGIMGLAAAIKHYHRFSRNDILFISFTGHGAKDMDGIAKLVPHSFSAIKSAIEKTRPDLLTIEGQKNPDNILIVNKDIDPKKLNRLIQKKLKFQGEKK